MYRRIACGIITLLLLLFSLPAQSRNISEAPWAAEKEPDPSPRTEIYLPLEFFGGNVLNYGMGAAFGGRRLDIQFQGGFSTYKWEEASYYSDDYQTWGFTLGGDISHHLLFGEKNLGLYYGLFYRFNHIENMVFTAFSDKHWTGLSLGGEIQRDRLTFYGESLWFLENFYLDIPHVTFAGGVKFWLSR